LAEDKFDVAIIGLGYVGMPLAQACVSAGYRVVGIDTSHTVVERLNNGQSHVDDISDDDLSAMLRAGFHAASDASPLRRADRVVVCVPTPLAIDGSPDLTAVRSAVSAIRDNIQPGTLVILESTTFPGTTEDVVAPMLKSVGEPGREYLLAFSPERVDPGNAVFGIRNTPKIVGGVTPRCTAGAVEFYAKFVDTVVPARGAKEAETAKLLENTYRHINIALVNEMARVCREMDIDVWDVIRCASTKPFGFQAFYPGPGVGGHCIPIDPNYLSFAVKSKLGYPLRFVELAQEINQTMPHYVYRRVQDLLNDEGLAMKGARVLLVGVTYKPNIADQRESPADDLFKHLDAAGAIVEYHDQFVRSWTPSGTNVPRAHGVIAQGYDVAVFLQHHDGTNVDELIASSRRVLDTRGKLRGERVTRL
jgi:nucleotide sugar dehydrogenase